MEMTLASLLSDRDRIIVLFPCGCAGSSGIDDKADAAEDISHVISVKPPNSIRQLALSIVKSCVTFTTLSLESLPSPLGSNTLPGASARRRFDVKAHTMAVVSRLRLKTSFRTMTNGRRNPDREPDGSPRSTQNKSP